MNDTQNRLNGPTDGQDIRQLPGEQVSRGVYLCPDGKYRWIYEFDMRKNPTVMISVMRVLLLAYGIIMAFMIALHLFEGTFENLREYWDFYKWFLLLLAFLLLLSVFAYAIVARSFGWRYVLFYTMDEEHVESRPLRQQADKAKALSWLTVLAGLAAGRPGTVGAGLNAASRDVAVSVFQKVRKVKTVRRRHVVYVNHRLVHNQIYAEKADLEFVRDFIVAHCPNARIRG